MVDPLRVRTLLDRLGGAPFIVAIEACIDIGRHLIASERWRAPRDYADVFTVLGENDVLTAKALVHEYIGVDEQRVVEILHTRVDDLQGFRQALADVVRTAME